MTEYVPKLSEKLKTHLEKKCLLENFLKDYKQICEGFRPTKIYLKGEETKPKSYGKLSNEEKKELEKVGMSYAHAIHQLLELALKCNELKKKFTLIGGFGVLGHLYKFNPNFAHKWRGTEDIDILSSENIVNTYMHLGFKKSIAEKIDTTHIPDGKLDTFVMQNPYHDRPLKIQDRRTIKFPGGKNRDESNKIHNKREKVELYGVPIFVASKEHLINTKTGIRKRKDKLGNLKDKHDITHLKSIIKLEDKVS